MSKKEEVYTTQDIQNNIDKMVKEELPLDAPVEVTIEGDDDVYSIESVGHFHAVPNMTLRLKLKGYVKKNADFAFTLRRFLDLYNFRQMVDNREDTQIIRIYNDFPSKYIEFGVNEWNWSDKMDIIESHFNKKMLERIVTSFNYDEDRNTFCVHLQETE